MTYTASKNSGIETISVNVLKFTGTKDITLLEVTEVWPGDTNNDGKVSIIDILPIGRFWNKNGYVRKSKDISWKCCLISKKDWNPVEAAFADADGNGVVDENDVVIVAQNWKKERTIANPAPASNNFRADEGMLDKYQKMYNALSKAGDSEGAIALRDALIKLIAELKPQKSILLENYPNPFNPDTWIPYILSEDNEVTITIYDVSGRLVRTINLGWQKAGYYTDLKSAVYWNGQNEVGERVSSGIYFYRLKAGDFVAIGKMIALK